MPWICVRQCPPPRRRTVLVRAGGAWFFAALFRENEWRKVPDEHQIAEPQAWLYTGKLTLPIFVPESAPPRPLRLKPTPQLGLNFDGTGGG